MRKIIVGAQVSMDGVMQAPGGPTEDPTQGFKLGGWLPEQARATEEINQGAEIGQYLARWHILGHGYLALLKTQRRV